MAAKLESRALPDRLEYRVYEFPDRLHLSLRSLAWIVGISVVSIVAIHESPVFSIFFIGFLGYVAFSDMLQVRRGTDVTLTVTERDVISDGYTVNQYFPINRWRKQAPDLYWQEEHSSDDGPIYPHGIYCGGDCVLPLVSIADGHRIVEEVYTRFPDTACDSRYEDSPVPSPITTLGLTDK